MSQTSLYKRRHRSIARTGTNANAPFSEVLVRRPRRIVRQGIKRQAPRYNTAAHLPVSDRHKVVLRALTHEPQGAALIQALCGVKMTATQSALYALQARGLALRVQGKGWRRICPGWLQWP